MKKTEWMQLDANSRATIFSQFVETVEATRLRVERERIERENEPKAHVLAYRLHLAVKKEEKYERDRERWVEHVVGGDTDASFSSWMEDWA
jgi:hypothetical protein